MELLLCAQDLGDYDVGDIIDIRPDGFNWGSQESSANPRFNLIGIPDAQLGGDVDTARATYLTFLCEGDENGDNCKQRKYCVDTDAGELIEKTVDSMDPFSVSTSVAANVTVTQL